MFKHKSCHKSNKTAFNRMARCMLWVVAPVGMCLCCMLVLSWQHIFRKGSHCGPIVHATKSRYAIASMSHSLVLCLYYVLATGHQPAKQMDLR